VYPGNAVNLSWAADSLVIIFGELTNQNGTPVENALIHGVAGLATTDDFGQFQAEISPQTQELRFETISDECTVRIPEYEAEGGIGFLPPMTCTMVAKE
jgi:Mat/Ecp fimbriae outer membrane usher protein